MYPYGDVAGQLLLQVRKRSAQRLAPRSAALAGTLVRLYESDRFWIDIQNQAKFSFFFVGQCLGLGFLLAVLLDRPILGESFFKTIYIFPFAVSSIVTGVIWRWLMYPDTGLNLLFRGAGLLRRLARDGPVL